MSNTLDFVQTYVTNEHENDNLRKTDFKVKSCSEALIFIIVLLNQICIYVKTIYIYIYIYIYCVFIGKPMIYYFPYNSEISVNK